jgi:TPR repeat protein
LPRFKKIDKEFFLNSYKLKSFYRRLIMSVPNDKLNSCTSSDGNTTPLLFNEKIHLLNISSLKRLIQQNRIDAMRELADRYQHGIGGAQIDNEAASQWFMSAAKRGDEYSRAICLQYGYGCEKNCRAAFQLYEKLTCKGINAKAEFALGLMYTIGGDGIEKDNMKAFKLFQKAAEEEYAPAQYYLGACYEANIYENDQPIGKNERDAKAMGLYEKAAEQGYILAKNAFIKKSLKAAGLPEPVRLNV